MKKISYYLITIIIAGVVISSFWIYQKYFKKEVPDFLLFQVERGDIQEIIKARGEVVAQKDFDLQFPFSENIERIFVKEGQKVNQGAPLIKLETINFNLEVQRLKALLNQSEANLKKLIAGPTEEDLRVYETKVENTKITLLNNEKLYLNTADVALSASKSVISDSVLSTTLSKNNQTLFIEQQFLREIAQFSYLEAKSSINKADLTKSKDDILIAYDKLSTNLKDVGRVLEKISAMLDATPLSLSITQAYLDASKSTINTQRLNISSAIVNLATAKANFEDANRNLAFKKAGARPEDIEIAEAQIEEIRAQIAAAEEKIRKSILYSPSAAQVTKIWYKESELYQPGQTAISLIASGYKIQADISELDIGKIKEKNGNDVLIKLDAFPDKELKGKLISIDPKEIIKEGNKYYRVNIFFEDSEKNIRSGMSADLIIYTVFKKGVLKIPEIAVFQKGGKSFVKVLENKTQKELEIETGISDGESIEVIKGLSEGQTVIVVE